MNEPRIADFRDYIKSLSDKGLIIERNESDGVDLIICDAEILRRKITVPRRVWKFEKSTEEHDHDQDFQEQLHQDRINEVTNIFVE